MFSSSIEFFVVLLLATLGGLFVAVPRIDLASDNPATEQVEAADQGVEDAQAGAEETGADDGVDVAQPDSAGGAVAPIVDVMRFDGQQGVVSGKAEPNAEVIIMDGDAEVARGQADASGNFALTFDYQTPADGGVLQLSSVGANGQMVSADELLTILPQAGGETATVNLSDEGVEVNAPATQELALSEMRYGANAPWILSGSAAPGALVDLFLNGEKIGSTTANDKGQWSYEGEAVAPGSYELGLSQNGSEVVTRTLTLEGEAEDVAGGATAQGQDGAGSEGGEKQSANLSAGQTISVGGREYRVKRGDSLWRIAEHFYGEGQGARYTEIFDVNSSQIRNPDLIYPEQEFEIPKDN